MNSVIAQIQQNKKYSPLQLDAQSQVKISRWVDLDSEDHRMMDEDCSLTKKFLIISVEAGNIFIDTLGRVWGRGKDPDGPVFPYHFEHSVPGRKTKLIGIRIAKKASN